MAEVLDTKQACDYLNIAKPTLYKYVRSGELPAVKFGRIWRFHRVTLEKWLEERVKNDTASRKSQKRR